jgi:glucosamine--fructose-6-phosphate aminotransferase (isomerizing)
MCGIIGYTGMQEAAPILLDGLERLEYRGYDSAGIAVFESSDVEVIKAKGRLAVLKQKVVKEGHPKGVAGIGHTRWATHGAPSDTNAHPHKGSKGIFTIVHNGIIENYAPLRSELETQGIRFDSETDTEVIVQLLDRDYNGNPLETIVNVLKKLHGSMRWVLYAEISPTHSTVQEKHLPCLRLCE